MGLLADVNSRKEIALPTISYVKLTTVCMCCSSLIEKGYVCSVCLAGTILFYYGLLNLVYCEKTHKKFYSKCFICK